MVEKRWHQAIAWPEGLLGYESGEERVDLSQNCGTFVRSVGDELVARAAFNGLWH